MCMTIGFLVFVACANGAVDPTAPRRFGGDALHRALTIITIEGTR